MLKVTKNKYINENMLEAVCLYKHQKPLHRLVLAAQEKGMYDRFIGRRGLKSMLIMNDGYIICCPYMPETYMSRLDESQYFVVDTRKFYIRKDMVRILATKLSSGQKREIKKAKQSGNYIMLSGNKKTKYYLFTVSGRIYGVQQVMNLDEPE